MNPNNQKFTLALFFSLVAFAILFFAVLLSGLLVFVLARTGLLSPPGVSLTVNQGIILMSAVSVLLGAAIGLFASRIPLKPLNLVIDKMNRLASGDFQTRLHFGRLLRRYPAFSDVADSFNKMAEELENTEVLRSDFINNFSHEFKTPIVSIAGFARLLRRGNLTEQQREEYLSIIESESLRLSCMATNVLNLTKLENQTILTGVTRFNLSEQLRSCVLLLERDWAAKELDVQLDFDEYEITASEELLKEVWINLLDNAVKFSPQTGEIRLTIRETAERLAVSVTNFGSEIPPECQGKIFNKFYQADESHASAGSGIGLAIVKRVTELHGGTVAVESHDSVTTFTVSLPKAP